MRKKLFILFAFLCCLATTHVSAQTYSAWGRNPYAQPSYDTIHFNGDTLVFTFSSVPTGAWGTGKLVVYYEGDFGDVSEYLTVFGPGLTNLGQTPSTVTDCVPEDSVEFSIASASINSWTPNITFRLAPSYNVDQFCARNRAKVRLEFDYCPYGTPAEMARIRWSDSLVTFVCPMHGPQDLSPSTPAGGSFSGAGMTGSDFDPAGLPEGAYTIVYTATDSIGCVTSDDTTFYVLPAPHVPTNAIACPGGTSTIAPNGFSNFVWYSDEALTTALDTTPVFETPPLSDTTSYWVQDISYNYKMWSDSLVSANYAIVDHNAYTGDDRGGVIVTQHYVYVMGDFSGVRYDVNLTPGSATTVPLHDALFSDLHTGEIWSLWNTQTNSEPNFGNDFEVNAIRWSDSLVNFTNRYRYLSQTIDMGNPGFRNGIFAGYGAVGLYSGENKHFYVVDLDNGQVTDLDTVTIPFYGSESWADWGVLERDCDGSYAILFRSITNVNAITRMTIPGGTMTSAANFSAGLSDMASFTLSPWNHRWYFHYEGSSGTFGGIFETLGYADAIGSVGVCGSAVLGCATKVTVVVDSFPPDSELICVVTVDSVLNKNQVIWERTNPVNGGFYNIYKETTQAGVYALVRSQPQYMMTKWSDSLSSPQAVAARYKISVTDTCGRESTISAYHKTIHLTINAGPSSTWNLIWSHYEGFPFLTYYIYRGFSPGTLTAIDSIQGNLNSWTDLTPPAGPVYYAVIVKNPNTCEPSYSNIRAANLVGTEELATLEQSLTLTPNPGDGQFNCSFTTAENVDAQLTISDCLGRTVYEQKVENVNGTYVTAIDLRTAGPGVYIVALTTKDGTVTKKLVVQ